MLEWPNRFLYAPIKSVFTQHQRRVLIFLIFIIALFSISLSIFSIYLASVFYQPDHTDGIVTWLLLALVGVFLMSICLVGIRGAHLFNLELLLSFFWGVMVFIAPLLLGIVSCYDLYIYLRIFYNHSWDSPSFTGVRQLFCRPLDTANTKCAVPLDGGISFDNVNDWCMFHYNSTDCGHIRDNAIDSAVSVSVVVMQIIIMS